MHIHCVLLPQFIGSVLTPVLTPHYSRIGSGTGIFTRALLSHPGFSNSVKELKAVEPSDGMRNFFIKSTVETDPENRVNVRDGTFDKTGIEDGVADMIVMAQVSLFLHC